MTSELFHSKNMNKNLYLTYLYRLVTALVSKLFKLLTSFPQ